MRGLHNRDLALAGHALDTRSYAALDRGYVWASISTTGHLALVCFGLLWLAFALLWLAYGLREACVPTMDF